jgi:hypothetical protein
VDALIVRRDGDEHLGDEKAPLAPEIDRATGVQRRGAVPRRVDPACDRDAGARRAAVVEQAARRRHDLGDRRLSIRERSRRDRHGDPQRG